MSVDILGTSWDQCRSMVQSIFTSTETRRLVRTDSPGGPPRLSHSSWTMQFSVIRIERRGSFRQPESEAMCGGYTRCVGQLSVGRKWSAGVTLAVWGSFQWAESEVRGLQSLCGAAFNGQKVKCGGYTRCVGQLSVGRKWSAGVTLAVWGSFQWAESEVRGLHSLCGAAFSGQKVKCGGYTRCVGQLWMPKRLSL